MGKASRDKGIRRERQIVELHRALGIHAERVPLSGAQNYQDNGADVDVYAWGRDGPPLVAECKARSSGEGWKTLERWLEDYDLLFLIRDRAAPLVTMPWDTYQKLVTGTWKVTSKEDATDAKHDSRSGGVSLGS